MQVTTDGGQTWRAAANPSQSVLRLSWVALDNAFVVAAAQPGCGAGFWRTVNSGEFWDGPVPPLDVWHLLPSSEATELHAPGGVVPSPCGQAGTYELEPQPFGSTFVMCRDGRVFRTDDEAQTWTRSGQEPAAVAMGLLEQRPVLAVDGRSDCAGIAVERPDGTRIGCIQGADARGAVALNFAGDSSGLFLSGARAWDTNDGGATWTGAG